jgi:hypothetical protein
MKFVHVDHREPARDPVDAEVKKAIKRPRAKRQVAARERAMQRQLARVQKKKGGHRKKKRSGQ